MGPMASELNQEWKNNFKSLFKYSEAVYQGIHGFVYDSNGKPIKKAEIQINERKKVVHSNGKGAFWRLLLPGNYKVVISAEGYNKLKTTVRVTNQTLFKNYILTNSL